MADEDLSDEQLRQLLKDAELRLKAAKGRRNTQDNALQRYCTLNIPVRLGLWHMLLLTFVLCSIPKIDSGKSVTSYIQKTSQGAQVNPSHLVKPEERKLANGIRRVDDPVAVKAKAEKVRSPYPYLSNLSSMRKIYPKNLDAESGPVLGTTLQKMML